MTVHLVIKQSGSTSASPSPAPASPAAAPAPSALPATSTGTPSPGTAPPDIAQSPFGLGGFGGIPGLGNLGMGSANFMEMQQRMQRDLMSNPDMLRQVGAVREGLTLPLYIFIVGAGQSPDTELDE